MKKKLLLTVLMLSSVLTLAGCQNSTYETNTTQNVQNTEKSEVSKTNKESTTTESKKTVINVGETWTVDDQWSLTINSVKETPERNQFSDKEPGAVYIIDYTYTNLGYEDSSGIMDGLYLSIDSGIVDNAGVMGYSYPGNITSYPQQTPVGATCSAQVCIGVDNPGAFTINFSQYDSNSKKQSAQFNVAVE